VHGAAEAEQAIDTSRSLFEGRGATETPGTGEIVFTGHAPTVKVSRTGLRDLSIVELLVASGLAKSKADARRGIQGRGFYLNDEPIEATDLQLADEQLQGPPEERFVLLRKGKKNYVRLVLEP
jgi:tyrosyl-tRNA synthetase